MKLTRPHRVVAFTLVITAFLIPLSRSSAYLGSSVLGRSVSLGSLTFTGVFPRIFTPNGDSANDKAAFHFDNPEVLPVAGKIFDLAGAQVAQMAPGKDPTSLLLWDGKDSDGRVVAGGIYLYQIDFQGKYATGTVVVAR